MNYNDSDFENYLNGKMTNEEKLIFEADLLLSSELAENLKSYKKVNQLVRETKEIKLNEKYSSDILLRFRNKLNEGEKNKPLYKIGAFVTALASLVLGFILTFNFFVKDTGSNLDLTNLTESEKELIINSFDIADKIIFNSDSKSIEIMDSIYKDALAQNITIEYEIDDTDNITIDFLGSDFEEYVSDEEIDYIYSSLINKDIL